MRDYKLYSSNTITRLTPTFMRNPRMFAWASSITFPLDTINREFVEFAKQKKREAQISSQTQLLQDYLNATFNLVLPYPKTDYIYIVHGIETAQATFFDAETPPDNLPYTSGDMFVYGEDEIPLSPKQSPFTNFDYEDFGTLPEDFRLILPESIFGNDKIVRRIWEVVDKYVTDTNKYDTIYSNIVVV